MTPTTHLYITDKKGGKHFRVTCGTAYKDSEYRNLYRHIEHARRYPAQYHFLDFATAKIVEE